MNADLTREAAAELEVLEGVRKYLRTLRASRNRPELAIPASRWEMTVAARILELERTAPAAPATAA